MRIIKTLRLIGCLAFLMGSVLPVMAAEDEQKQDKSVLDVDGSGDVHPLTDGLMIIRSLLGFTGEALTDGAVDLSNCVDCTSQEVAQNIATITSLNYGQLNSTDDQNISGSALNGTVLTIGIENGTSETVDLASLIEGLGITTEQAEAIIANTAKTGITTDQAEAIAANTAKNGITAEQASAIEANTAKSPGAAQNISGSGLSGTTLTIGIEGGNSETVDLSGLQDGTGTDDQNISGSGLSGTTLTIGIEGGNSETVNLSGLQDGTGTDDQNISGSGLSGTTLTIGIEGGNSETVNLSGLRDGIGTDDQNISGSGLSGTTLTIGIENGSSETVNLSSLSNATNITGLSDALVEDNSYYLGNDPSGTTSSAEYNVAVGGTALDAVTSGDQNVAVGYDALTANTTGSNNVAVGPATLAANTTGTNNTAIGASADVASNSLTNATAIGYGASVAASNTMQLGNPSVTNVKTSGSLTTGAITIPNTDGTAGQVLKTDGSGTLSWGSGSSGFSVVPRAYAQSLTTTGSIKTFYNQFSSQKNMTVSKISVWGGNFAGGDGSGATVVAGLYKGVLGDGTFSGNLIGQGSATTSGTGRLEISLTAESGQSLSIAELDDLVFAVSVSASNYNLRVFCPNATSRSDTSRYNSSYFASLPSNPSGSAHTCHPAFYVH